VFPTGRSNTEISSESWTTLSSKTLVSAPLLRVVTTSTCASNAWIGRNSAQVGQHLASAESGIAWRTQLHGFRGAACERAAGSLRRICTAGACAVQSRSDAESNDIRRPEEKFLRTAGSATLDATVRTEANAAVLDGLLRPLCLDRCPTCRATNAVVTALAQSSHKLLSIVVTTNLALGEWQASAVLVIV
jgi:hypothetical protein